MRNIEYAIEHNGNLLFESQVSWARTAVDISTRVMSRDRLCPSSGIDRLTIFVKC